MSIDSEIESEPINEAVESGLGGEVRMSFGDHLEELRSCLIRGLLGVIGGTTLAFIFGDHILAVLFRPLAIVQAAHGMQPQLQALSPASTFMAYMKVAFLAGLIVGMPWLLNQAWRFVAVGLYPRERRFVKMLIWPSVGLFVLGVLFLYFIVLPLMLQFFITFNRAFPIPDLTPASVQKWLLPAAPPGAGPVDWSVSREKMLVVDTDPDNAQVGDLWLNAHTGRIVFKTPGGLRSVATEPGSGGTIIQSQFALDQYISFVLTLALAFGVAFETPVAVFFLAAVGLVSTETMRRGRRYVILVTVIAAAVITPTPDIIGQLLLAGPMYLLFELGVFFARLRERRERDRVSEEISI